MALFSERYNYVKPSEVLLRECFPEEVANGVCSCYDGLEEQLACNPYQDYGFQYADLEEHLWVYFLYKRKSDFYVYQGHTIVATSYLLKQNVPWYKKLDLIEVTVKFLSVKAKDNNYGLNLIYLFELKINEFFKRLNYSYKIVNHEVVEITSEEEVVAIETAINSSKDNIKVHFSNALSLYSRKPIGDYRNSIKESISAVEAYCREKTGENTLGQALKKLESSGMVLPKMLKETFEKLYAYTNQPDNGIRHALMDDDDKYVPGQEEALFMLVSCCSFLNYLKKKETL